ncbi:MAG: AAA family ATPase [Candidatus Lambdaproteobacteria bacterium]|nr:AAA family ATPase [Candidatus Lambdaproteobacteria bacterium]
MSHEVHAALTAIRNRLDHFVVGHGQVKEALLLALIGREHFYLQGEPGCAKTLLAEVAGHAAGLAFEFCQFHRDTRLNDLLGDVVLRRSRQADGGEIIEQTLRHGGLLRAQIAVLDDITRAPGEALNVLLRLLNEREYLSQRIPLMSAIATTNPTGDEYYNEPLDPANLDRFTLQFKAKGALGGSDFELARSIMDRYDGFQPNMEEGEQVSAELLERAYQAHRQVKLPRYVLRAYLKFVHDLVHKYGCTPANSLLTDRTMLVKAPRMIKAMALLQGRTSATPDDLRVLKYILTFRIPEELYEQLDELLEQLIEEAEQADAGEQDSAESEQMEGIRGQEEGESEGDEQQQQDAGDSALADEILESVQSQQGDAENLHSIQQQAQGGDDNQSKFQRNQMQPVTNIELLMNKIKGRLEENPAESEQHPGGSPRTYKRMKTFEEFLDSDPVETSIWLERTHPTLPRAFRREKKHLGGKVVIIRDVSQSMEGRYARWTSSVVTRLVDMVRKKRMRIGYIEFNHVSHKYHHDGRFFTRDYDKIVEIATNVSCSGVTNYQFPLRDALDELRAGATHNKHIVFLTDGEPTQGDWLVREERRMARVSGVSIHTLFIGTSECPEILDILSEESDGFRFLAIPDDKGGLNLQERTPRTPVGPQPISTLGPEPLKGSGTRARSRR